MTKIPVPPAHLTNPARSAWERLYRNLAGRGEWDDLYLIALELAAGSCALYLTAATTPGADPKLVEDARLNARRALAEMRYIPEARINFATLTISGLDVDIVAACAPLE